MASIKHLTQFFFLLAVRFVLKAATHAAELHHCIAIYPKQLSDDMIEEAQVPSHCTVEGHKLILVSILLISITLRYFVFYIAAFLCFTLQPHHGLCLV